MQPRKPGRSSPTTRDWRPTLELRTIWKSCVARCAELTNFWASKILNWCRLEQRFFLAWNLTKQTTTERKQMKAIEETKMNTGINQTFADACAVSCQKLITQIKNAKDA